MAAIPAAAASGYSPATLVPSPWPSLTSCSQWAPEQRWPLTWLFFPVASGLEGGHAWALEDREHESCCHQITCGGCSRCAAPVHCRHPSRQLPASSLTFPDCPGPLPPPGPLHWLGTLPPVGKPPHSVPIHVISGGPSPLLRLSSLMCLGPKCPAIHVRPLPHYSCHPPAAETCIQVLKQGL